LKETEEVTEKIDAGVFGNLAHLALEKLYLDFIERKKRTALEKGDFADLRKNWVFPAVEKAIREQYHLEGEADTKLNGQLAIARDVLQRYVRQVLVYDEQSAPFRLISLEKAKRYEAGLSIQTQKGPREAVLRGIIDRVDEHQGSIRLIDYKSGGDKKEFPHLDALFDRSLEKRNKAAMQTLFYGLIYQGSHPENTAPLKPAIFNLKEIFNDDFNPYLKEREGRREGVEVQDYRNFETDFRQKLKDLLEELYDPLKPFDQTAVLKKCEYCPYKEICGR